MDRPSTATTPAQPVLGVIIPAYNEERSIELITRRVLKQAPVRQVVVVDDCSSEGTLAAARRCTDDPRVTVKHHEVNIGKGAAIRTALESITTELVIIQDADLEYDPADYEHLVSPILRGRSDVVSTSSPRSRVASCGWATGSMRSRSTTPRAPGCRARSSHGSMA